MKITLISIPVRDQEKALKFYTEILGFIVKIDKELEGGHRWTTLVSKDDPTGVEILLEPAPIHFEPSKVYQDALKDAGIPYTQFNVADVDAVYKRLSDLNVAFSVTPKQMGDVKYATFDDTCGNFITLVQE